MATVAVFIALGGGAYAAATIGSAQIKNNSIRSKDIRNNAVAGGDVKNRSLSQRDFKPRSLPAGPRGSRGAPGPPGPRGAGGSAAASYVGGRSQFNHLGPAQYSLPTGESQMTTTLADAEIVTPARRTVARDLFVSHSGHEPAVKYTLMVNGVQSALTCTTTTAGSCSNTANAVSLAPGSRIALRSEDLGPHPGGGATYPISYRFGWRATTP